MLLNEEILQILNEERAPLSDMDLAKRVNLNMERMKYFRLYLQSMVDTDELREKDGRYYI